MCFEEDVVGQCKTVPLMVGRSNTNNIAVMGSWLGSGFNPTLPKLPLD